MKTILSCIALAVLLPSLSFCQNSAADGAEKGVAASSLNPTPDMSEPEPSTPESGGEETPAEWIRKIVDTEYAFAELSDRFKAAAQQRFLMDQAVLVYAEGARRFHDSTDAPRALYAAGEVLKARGRLEEALEMYSSVVGDFIENDYSDRAQYKIAMIHYMRKDYETAQKSYYRLIDTYLRSDLVPDSFVMVAQCYQDIMSYEKAIRTYRKVLDTYDDSVVRLKALTGLAETLMKSGDYDQAASMYETIRAEYPDSAAYDHAEYMLGKTYAMQGEFPAARRILNAIVNSSSMNEYVDDAAYTCAWTYYSEKKYAHAIESYSLAMTRYPDHEEYTTGLENVADSYANLYLYRDAMIRYEELLQKYESRDATSLTPSEKQALNQKIGDTLHTMASIYTKREEYENALAKLFEARDYYSGSEDRSSVEFAVAELYCKLGWYREALSAYDEFVTGNPFSPQLPMAYAHRAKCYDKMGYFKLAEEMYQKVLLMEPEEPLEEMDSLKREAVFRIAALYEEQNLIREEAEFLEKVMRENHDFLDEARLLYKLGTVYEDIDRLDSAASVYERILYGHKDSEWFDLAKLNLEIIRINQKSGTRRDR